MPRNLLIAAALVFMFMAGVGFGRAAAANPIRGDLSLKPWTIRLCASPSASPGQMRHAAWITSQRLHAYGLTADIRILPARHCLNVYFGHSLSWLPRLAKDLREQGTFALGVFTPYDGRHVYAPEGMPVRYTTDPVTSRNRAEYAVRVLFTRKDFIPSSFELSGSPTVKTLSYQLTSTASHAWCRFTRHHSHLLDARLVDRRIVIVAHISGPICSAAGQISFSGPIPRYGPWSPQAFANDVQFGPLPLQWRSVTISEKQITD